MTGLLCAECKSLGQPYRGSTYICLLNCHFAVAKRTVDTIVMCLRATFIRLREVRIRRRNVESSSNTRRKKGKEYFDGWLRANLNAGNLTWILWHRFRAHSPLPCRSGGRMDTYRSSIFSSFSISTCWSSLPSTPASIHHHMASSTREVTEDLPLAPLAPARTVFY